MAVAEENAVTEPQWSPPVIGGSTNITELDISAMPRPQWSPPVIGGSTRIAYPAWHLMSDAAMEPAGYRREHHGTHNNARKEKCKPQWSPPVIGGSTLTTRQETKESPMPQWSPPVIGGSTARKI